MKKAASPHYKDSVMLLNYIIASEFLIRYTAKKPLLVPCAISELNEEILARHLIKLFFYIVGK